jgi:hypothetical protein
MRSHSSRPVWRLHRTLRLSFAAGVMAAALVAPSSVGAENSWDDGSPPPEDFGFQPTPEQSGVSAYNWLYSADGGASVYTSWTTSGVDTTLLESVSGGVQTGMSTATSASARR